MRKLFFLLLLVGSMHSLQAQVTIPDPAFAARLQVLVPNAINGNVLDTNHIDVISLKTLNASNSGSSDLYGIQFFDSLEILNCYGNQLTSLPALPSSLEDLYCYSNQLTSLPALPNSLVALFCSNNQLTSLPALPNSLLILRCIDNPLTSLPALPNSLELLTCIDNQLTSLPPLPNSLVTLLCYSNQLTSLPALPNSLVTLFCSNNQLTSLPALPNPLESLLCYGNQLTSLPALPNSLEILDCNYNQLTSLPALSNSLVALLCRGNQLTCLPVLPSSLDVLHCYGNSIDCLPNIPPLLAPYGTGSNVSYLGFNPVFCSPSNPCFPSEAITGTIFHDDNGNGQLDALELPFSTGVAEAQPGSYLSGVDINGRYGLPIGIGAYTVQGQPLLYHNITTPTHSVMIIPGHIDSLSHIGYQTIPGIYDLVVEMSAQATRPGFDNNVYLQVKNIGTETTTATIDLGFDADQTWVASTEVPALQSGNTASWSVPMAPGDTWNTAVTLNTAASVALGTSVYHWFAAVPTVSDTTPTNNSTNWNALVVGSYDPNDKTVVPSSMSPMQLLNGDAIEYTIRFQNTGTFLAENVRITDTLSSDLEWSSFEYISSSHSNYWYLSNGVLVFQFDNIQLPDSTSDEPNSNGFVKFRIKPSQNLLVGESVLNAANIFFDFNEPVITDPSVFIIDITSGVNKGNSSALQIYPNPTSGVLNLRSETEMMRVTIYQLDGRLLRSERASGVQHQVQIAELKQGVYLLEVDTKGGRYTRRVLKN